MGTSNFHTANAIATFVIDYKDDEYDCQECKEDLAESIKECLPNFKVHENITSNEELRSFPTSSIGFMCDSIQFLGIEFEFHINIFLRSGYYEASNLDWELEFFLDGVDYYSTYSDGLDDISLEPTTYNIKPGLWSIHKSNLENKLEHLQNSLIKQIESVFAKVSTPYGIIAQFSNGETLYTKL